MENYITLKNKSKVVYSIRKVLKTYFILNDNGDLESDSIISFTISKFNSTKVSLIIFQSFNPNLNKQGIITRICREEFRINGEFWFESKTNNRVGINEYL